MFIVLLEINLKSMYGLIFVGRGGKDEEWFIIGIIFSSEISRTYFIGEEAFSASPSVWKSYKSYVAQVFTGSASMLTEKYLSAIILYNLFDKKNKIHLINLINLSPLHWKTKRFCFS